MVRWSRMAALVGVVALFGLSCPRRPEEKMLSPHTPRRVAVLVVCEPAETDRELENSEFWYDTVLMYCMLRNNGFADADIYVLYGEGKDGFYAPTDLAGQTPEEEPAYYRGEGGYCVDHRDPGPITDFPVTSDTERWPCQTADADPSQCRPRAIFDCLARGCNPAIVFDRDDWTEGDIEPLSSEDSLFVWWNGHGASTQKDGLELTIVFDKVKEAQVREWLGAVPAKQRLLVFETCESGCLIPSLGSGADTILMTSCNCNEQLSNSLGENRFDTVHRVFSFWLAGTLGGWLSAASQPPVDAQTVAQPQSLSLGLSVQDAFDIASTKTTSDVDWAGRDPQEPQMRDDGDVAHETYLDPNPPARPSPTPSPGPGGHA